MERPKRNKAKKLDTEFVEYIRKSPIKSGIKVEAHIDSLPAQADTLPIPPNKKMKFEPGMESVVMVPGDLSLDPPHTTPDRPKRNKQKKLDPDFVESSLKSVKSLELESAAVADHDVKPDPEPSKKSRPVNSISHTKHQTTPASKGSQIVRTKRKQSVTGGTAETGLAKQTCRVTRCGDIPFCEIGTERCNSTGSSSRWYHVAKGEHYCNQCFEQYYRNTRGSDFDDYHRWRLLWCSRAKTDGSVKVFFQDQKLPWWLQCTLCNKWRRRHGNTPITPKAIAKFRCGKSIHNVDCSLKFVDLLSESCSSPEDPRVSGVLEEGWLRTQGSTPHLLHSPAGPLLTHFTPDTVGLSAFTYNSHRRLNGGSDQSSDSEDELVTPCPTYPPVAENLNPFAPYDSEEVPAGCVQPDVMTVEEQGAFPEYTPHQTLYLALRNLVLAMWATNCKRYLSARACCEELVCRGIVRVRCARDLARIIDYLTWRGTINYGNVRGVLDDGLLHNTDNQSSVVVVGAGIAGLGAARHLHNMGTKVVVLEARDRIGGRIKDTSLMGGHCVGEGAQMVNGTNNNPVTVLALQAGVSLRPLEDKCKLRLLGGGEVSDMADQRMDFHFNAMLDAVSSCSQRKTAAHDTSLQQELDSVHKMFLEESRMEFTELEKSLLSFHIANLEYACGAPLSEVSSRHWDHNEHYPQFTGPSCVLDQGYGVICTHLAKGLNIKLNSKVIAIERDSESVRVRTSSGQVYTAQQVLITLPLATLQHNSVTFNPPLPPDKLAAIKGLGAGTIEKVALHYDERFWSDDSRGPDFFGYVPEKEEEQGLFNFFYDVSSRGSEEGYVLLTYLSGRAVARMRGVSDASVVSSCVNVLRRIFPHKDVGEPRASFVTHWGEESESGMSYSYVPLHSTPAHYSTLAQNINQQLFFAGEATNRQHPQSVTGAYMSGVREACHISAHLYHREGQHEGQHEGQMLPRGGYKKSGQPQRTKREMGGVSTPHGDGQVKPKINGDLHVSAGEEFSLVNGEQHSEETLKQETGGNEIGEEKSAEKIDEEKTGEKLTTKIDEEKCDEGNEIMEISENSTGEIVEEKSAEKTVVKREKIEEKSTRKIVENSTENNDSEISTDDIGGENSFKSNGEQTEMDIDEEDCAQRIGEENSKEDVSEEKTGKEIDECAEDSAEDSSGTTGKENSAEETAEEKVTLEMGTESSPKINGEEKSVEKLGEEKSRKIGEEKSRKIGEEKSRKIGEEISTEKIIEEKSTEKIIEEQSTEKIIEEQSTEKVGEEKSPQQISEEQSTAKIGENKPTEKIGQENFTHQSAEEDLVIETEKDNSTQESQVKHEKTPKNNVENTTEEPEDKSEHFVSSNSVDTVTCPTKPRRRSSSSSSSTLVPCVMLERLVVPDKENNEKKTAVENTNKCEPSHAAPRTTRSRTRHKSEDRLDHPVETQTTGNAGHDPMGDANTVSEENSLQEDGNFSPGVQTMTRRSKRKCSAHDTSNGKSPNQMEVTTNRKSSESTPQIATESLHVELGEGGERSEEPMKKKGRMSEMDRLMSSPGSRLENGAEVVTRTRGGHSVETSQADVGASTKEETKDADTGRTTRRRSAKLK